MPVTKYVFATLTATVCDGKVKVKQTLYMPEEDLSVSGNWGIQIWKQPEHEGGKFVSLTHRPPLPPRNYSWYFC